MKNIIVAIGGTGERVTEAFIHLAAAGAVDAGDYEICCVDMDIDCPDFKNCREMLNLYKTTREDLAGNNSAFMKANITKPNIQGNESTWELSTEVCNLLGGSISLNNKTLDDLAKNDPLSKMLLEFFHNDVERGTTVDKDGEYHYLNGGFYGSPAAGAALIKAIFENTSMQDNPLGQILNENIQTDIAITLVASTFGATGASIFPNLAEKLREYHNSLQAAPKGKLYLNGVLMLPYCTYPHSDGNAINPGEFYKKTVTILRYYATKSNFIREGTAEEGFTLDSLHLIGTGDTLLQLNASNYCKSGKDQAHRFLEKDLLGAIAIRDTFTMAANGNTGHRNNIYGFADDPGCDNEIRKLGEMAETWIALQSYLYPTLKYLDTLDGINNKKLKAAVACADRRSDLLKVFSNHYSKNDMKASTKDEGILKDIGEIVKCLEHARHYFERYMEFLLNLQTLLQPIGELSVNNQIDVLKVVDNKIKIQDEYDNLKETLPAAAANKDTLKKARYFIYGTHAAAYGQYEKKWRDQTPLAKGTTPKALDFLKEYAKAAHQVAAHG